MIYMDPTPILPCKRPCSMQQPIDEQQWKTTIDMDPKEYPTCELAIPFACPHEAFFLINLKPMMKSSPRFVGATAKSFSILVACLIATNGTVHVFPEACQSIHRSQHSRQRKPWTIQGRLAVESWLHRRCSAQGAHEVKWRQRTWCFVQGSGSNGLMCAWPSRYHTLS